MGSRSLQQGGVAVHEAAGVVVEKAKAVAARLLEADVADVVLDKASAVFHVAGAPAVSKSWADLGAAAEPGELTEESVFQAAMPTYPFGSHIAVVEVDTDTGHVRHLRHIACDDAGTMVNPMTLKGHIRGGTASGIGTALYEHFHYDKNGQLENATLSDYLIPTLYELPRDLKAGHIETPSPFTEYGIKGGGEGGRMGAPPAIAAAIEDALKPLGVKVDALPVTPRTLRRLIREKQPAA
jgi:carbon-monoxide dehydrogenase large subunit